MKKHIIAIIAIAGIVSATEYPVNVSIPIKTEVVITKTNVTESVTASVFVLERFVANVESPTNTAFIIHGSYRDVNNKVLKHKVILVKMEKAAQMLKPYSAQIVAAISSGQDPLSAIMFYAKLAIEANIQTLLAE